MTEIAHSLYRSKETIYAKLISEDGMFEEMIQKLPIDIIGHYQNNEREFSEEQLGYMVRLAYEAYGDDSLDYNDLMFPFQFHFSIINDWILEHDQVLYEEFNPKNERHCEYSPCFLEFSGYCRDWEECIYLYKALNFGNEIRMSFKAFFLPDNSDARIERIREEYKVHAVLRGEVLASASPLETVRGQLVLVDDNSKIPKEYQEYLDEKVFLIKNACAYKNCDKAEIKKRLDSVFQGILPKKACTYNVGQGNCIGIYMSNGTYVFSDIGMTKSKMELKDSCIVSAKEEINGITDITAVVLSHWDVDHILGVTNADKAIYDAMWIVPDLSGLRRKSDSAKRLLKYLDWKNSKNLLIITDTFVKELVYENGDESISIWAGERKDIRGKDSKKKCFTINKDNNFGLVLFLKGLTRSVLCPGDCDYEVLADGLCQKDMDYLIVPHHCSVMSFPKIDSKWEDKKAIISYGIDNLYGHPDRNHMKNLFDKGYEIVPIVNKVKYEADLES